MLIRDMAECREITAGDNTLIKELLSPLKDPILLNYSLALGRLEPGEAALLHRLESSEVYYILSGEGEMQAGGERARVGMGQAVYIPPGAPQRIANTGGEELVFLCIVDPAWREEDEEILE